MCVITGYSFGKMVYIARFRNVIFAKRFTVFALCDIECDSPFLS